MDNRSTLSVACGSTEESQQPSDRYINILKQEEESKLLVLRFDV
jgi:hypothetical protein